jgi:hypothetical protein
VVHALIVLQEMKPIFSLLLVAVLVGCKHNNNNMSNSDLPSDWIAGELVPYSQTYSDPPKSDDSSRLIFYGLREGDPGHRLYSIPAGTSVADIVRVFAVGSHSEMSYGDDASETVAIVADKATRIADIIPCSVTFADPAGLHLRFSRQITRTELAKIEALFPETEDPFQSGLEAYISEYDGEGSIIERVIKENCFHFWWD